MISTNGAIVSTIGQIIQALKEQQQKYGESSSTSVAIENLRAAQEALRLDIRKTAVQVGLNG